MSLTVLNSRVDTFHDGNVACRNAREVSTRQDGANCRQNRPRADRISSSPAATQSALPSGECCDCLITTPGIVAVRKACASPLSSLNRGVEECSESTSGCRDRHRISCKSVRYFHSHIAQRSLFPHVRCRRDRLMLRLRGKLL
jgi:hypothetical protein